MKPKLVCSICALVAILLLPSLVYGQYESFWVVGRVSEVNDVVYDGVPYKNCSFSVILSNSSLSIGLSLVVVVPSSLLTYVLQTNGVYNFTGSFDLTLTNEIPDGNFVVSEITSVQNTTFKDWIDIGINLVTILSFVVRGIAFSLCQAVYALTGFLVPEWIVTCIIVAVSGYLILRKWKLIGVFVGVVLVFLVLSGVLNIVRIGLIS